MVFISPMLILVSLIGLTIKSDTSREISEAVSEENIH